MKSKLLLYLVLAFSAMANGQPFPRLINISVFNEATAIPFTRFITMPVHPGIQLGTEFNYNLNKEHSRLFQTANACYFYHDNLAHGIGLSSELGYEYRLRMGLAFTGLFGLGYMHTFSTSEEFKFVNGQYEKQTDKGNSRLYPSFSIDIGYYLKRAEKNSAKVFIRYQSWAEYPYSPDFIPLLTHVSLHVGAKFSINPKNRKHD